MCHEHGITTVYYMTDLQIYGAVFLFDYDDPFEILQTQSKNPIIINSRVETPLRG